jgi:hypothetical protein
MAIREELVASAAKCMLFDPFLWSTEELRGTDIDIQSS